MNFTGFAEDAEASPPCQPQSCLTFRLFCMGHVLHRSALRERVPKLVASVSFLPTAAKNCSEEESFDGVGPMNAQTGHK